MYHEMKFGIVGCGKVAGRHAIEANRNGQLVAVCDTDLPKAKALAEQFDCHAYESLEEMLQKEPAMTVVAICTPNALHASQAIQVMEHGHHVLCEKPLCIGTDDGKKMIEVSEKNKRKLFVVKSNRLNPQVIAVKEALDKGLFGKTYSFQLNCFWNRPSSYFEGSWHGTELDGGILYTQFSHYIDTILWFFGNIREVKGFRKNFSHPAIGIHEDTGVASLNMENGTLGGLHWSVNSFQQNMEISLSILGEKGSTRIGGPYMHSIDYQCPQFYEASVENKTTRVNSNHDKVYQNMVASLRNDSVPYVGGIEGLKAVQAISLIYSSIPFIR